MLKAVTLYQPWATLVAIGAKRIETREWHTAHRGPLAIHASSNTAYLDPQAMNPVIRRCLIDAGIRHVDELPLGAIVAVTRIIDSKTVARELDIPAEPERSFGDYAGGRKMWLLGAVHRVDPPVACRGARRIWTVPGDVERELRRVLATVGITT